MRSALFLFLGLATLLFAADEKRKPSKNADILILEAVARRSEGVISLDGRVKNGSSKPITKLVLLFDFLAPGKVPLTTQKLEVEDEVLEPGGETSFHAQLVDPVRAVRFRMHAEDGSGRYLKVDRNELMAIE